MNSDLCLLVSVLRLPAVKAPGDGPGLLKCAVRIPDGMNRLDCGALREHDELIATFLPVHVASVGPIVDVEIIFTIA